MKFHPILSYMFLIVMIWTGSLRMPLYLHFSTLGEGNFLSESHLKSIREGKSISERIYPAKQVLNLSFQILKTLLDENLPTSLYWWIKARIFFIIWFTGIFFQI